MSRYDPKLLLKRSNDLYDRAFLLWLLFPGPPVFASVVSAVLSQRMPDGTSLLLLLGHFLAGVLAAAVGVSLIQTYALESIRLAEEDVRALQQATLESYWPSGSSATG